TTYFWYLLKKFRIHISTKEFDCTLIKPLLQFCLPMAVFVILNSLVRDIDKWIVSCLGDTDEVAIYANCSRVLPFDTLATSLTTTLIPVITRNIRINKEKVLNIFKYYLNLCLITTCILVLPAIILSKQLLITLYAEDYLPGLNIFIIYLFIDMLRFANISIIFSTSGNSKSLMIIAGVSLLMNTFLATILYKSFGLTGPAMATLAVICLSSIFLFLGGGKILRFNLFDLLEVKNIGLILLEVIILFILNSIFTKYFSLLNDILHFFICYIPMICVLMLCNFGEIKKNFKMLNSIN
ncbi:MAG: oligosaccharide flippase family protein, partial [Muribaculaceae bacterium]|nr:oligosaccharide flippase family protein [Muribaculaceae bacterium]